MKTSIQDRYYLDVEADNFFDRNFKDQTEVPELRPFKKTLHDFFSRSGIKPRRIVEFGCGYGDMLNVLMKEGCDFAVGIEPSAKAVNFGNELYGDNITLFKGTIAENVIIQDESQHGSFDLVIIDDVFCWVSRETLFQSITTIDTLLKEGGYLLIRDFLPSTNVRNKNHHVEEDIVFCHKLVGGHASVFRSSGIYDVVLRDEYLDQASLLSKSYQSTREFESRWCDTILRKSYTDFYESDHYEKKPL